MISVQSPRQPLSGNKQVLVLLSRFKKVRFKLVRSFMLFLASIVGHYRDLKQRITHATIQAFIRTRK